MSLNAMEIYDDVNGIVVIGGNDGNGEVGSGEAFK